MVNVLKAISLFSCGGIGDLALREQGIDILVANELLLERAEVFKYNFPEVRMIVGDIWKEKDAIIKATQDRLFGHELDIVFATPPCQGMSKNGRGKLLNLVRKGERPTIDERNRLIIPAIDIFIALGARTLVMENVSEMEGTLIPKNGNESDLVTIPDYISYRLGSDYIRSLKIIEFADYGVPQRRQRLISIFSKDEKNKKIFYESGSLFPDATHSKDNPNKMPWVTVRDAISHTPELDAGDISTSYSNKHEYHKVPLLDEYKYLWVKSTPEGKTAFDNQCINPKCLFQGNATHGSSHDENGINKASQSTPIYCQKCGELLPRPWVETDGKFRLMKGYTSAYKRMEFDAPSSTLTRNLSYACSDNKLHPTQNRVLSIYEAMILHTLDRYEFDWKRSDGKKVSDKLIRELIGESVPPYGLSKLFEHLVKIHNGDLESGSSAVHGQLSLCFV